MPASPDNPLGQIVDTVGTLAIMITVTVLLGQVQTVGSAAWIGATVLIGVFGALVPGAVERGRWARRTAS